MNRRKFLLNSVKSVCLIGVGNTLQSFSPDILVKHNPAAISLRFAIASDGHYGQLDTPFDQYHDEMVAWINRDHEQHPIAFTIFNGDLIHDDKNLFAQVKRKYEQLDMPFYVSRGNHDHGDEAFWESVWNVKLNYSFEKGHSAFVVLNTANATGDVICPDVNWAKEELARYKKKKSLFVFMHVTPMKWTQNGMDCHELVELFRTQKNLKAIFHGHDHDQDYVKHDHDKPYFFDGHLGGNWGKDYRGYRIVEVMKNGNVLTYQVNPSISAKVNSLELNT